MLLVGNKPKGLQLGARPPFGRAQDSRTESDAGHRGSKEKPEARGSMRGEGARRPGTEGQARPLPMRRAPRWGRRLRAGQATLPHPHPGPENHRGATRDPPRLRPSPLSALTFLLPAVGRHCSSPVSAAAAAAAAVASTRLARGPQPRQQWHRNVRQSVRVAACFTPWPLPLTFLVSLFFSSLFPVLPSPLPSWHSSLA